MHDFRHLRRRDRPILKRMDDEVMSMSLRQGESPISGNPFILRYPLASQLQHRPFDKAGKLRHDVRGMLPRHLNLAGEGEVITHKYLTPHNQARRKRLVVRVTQAHYPGIVL